MSEEAGRLGGGISEEVKENNGIMLISMEFSGMNVGGIEEDISDTIARESHRYFMGRMQRPERMEIRENQRLRMHRTERVDILNRMERIQRERPRIHEGESSREINEAVMDTHREITERVREIMRKKNQELDLKNQELDLKNKELDLKNKELERKQRTIDLLCSRPPPRENRHRRGRSEGEQRDINNNIYLQHLHHSNSLQPAIRGASPPSNTESPPITTGVHTSSGDTPNAHIGMRSVIRTTQGGPESVVQPNLGPQTAQIQSDSYIYIIYIYSPGKQRGRSRKQERDEGEEYKIFNPPAARRMKIRNNLGELVWHPSPQEMNIQTPQASQPPAIGQKRNYHQYQEGIHESNTSSSKENQVDDGSESE